MGLGLLPAGGTKGGKEGASGEGLALLGTVGVHLLILFCGEEAFSRRSLGGEGVLKPVCASPTHVGLSVSARCWFSF